MGKNALEQLRAHLAARTDTGIIRPDEEVTSSDWSRLILSLDQDEMADLIQLIPEGDLPDVLSELDPDIASTILRSLPGDLAAEIVGTMDPDEAADLLDELSDFEANVLLDDLDPDEASGIRMLLAFDPDSAGGLMTPEFVAISPDVHVGQAIEGLRTVASEGAPQSYVYVLDSTDFLVGVLPLHALVLATPERPISELLITNPLRVRSSTSATDVARLLRDHNLIAVPVVDDDDRMLGVVTIESAVDVLESDIADDYLMQAGTDAAAMASRNPAQIARLRLPWLLGTMAIELSAGVVISRFDDVLTQVILLASFMPAISAVSGNVGLQAAAIVVRGLDTGHVQSSNWRRQLSREMVSTLLMAVACGLILGTVGTFWSGHAPFGIVIGVSMLCSMMTAGFMGTMIPMASQKLGFDPATTAGPFETAFQDVVGFAVFLWMASLLIDYLQ